MSWSRGAWTRRSSPCGAPAEALTTAPRHSAGCGWRPELCCALERLRHAPAARNAGGITGPLPLSRLSTAASTVSNTGTTLGRPTMANTRRTCPRGPTSSNSRRSARCATESRTRNADEARIDERRPREVDDEVVLVIERPEGAPHEAVYLGHSVQIELALQRHDRGPAVRTARPPRGISPRRRPSLAAATTRRLHGAPSHWRGPPAPSTTDGPADSSDGTPRTGRASDARSGARRSKGTGVGASEGWRVRLSANLNEDSSPSTRHRGGLHRRPRVDELGARTGACDERQA